MGRALRAVIIASWLVAAGCSIHIAMEYAARLKAYRNKGTCGAPEVTQTGGRLERSLEDLFDRVKRANGNVVV